MATRIVPQRFGQVGVEFGGADLRMPEQDLNDPDVHASFEQVRGEAVAQRVRPKTVIEAALASRPNEGATRGLIIHGSRQLSAGKEPLSAAVGLPDLPKHLQNRLGQRQNPLLVPLADDTQRHRIGGDRLNR